MKNNKKAVSPAISTVILVAAVVVMLLVTMTFANSFLNTRMAENEFSTIKNFMQTAALQTDDVAWTIGRTQTVHYTSRYGQVNFETATLNYTVYVDDGEGYLHFTNYSVGILMFNLPINAFSMGNNYYERLFPISGGDSFIQEGALAPVSCVYVIEKVPMNDGNYIRVVLVPSIRVMNSTITAGEDVKNYAKFYLPILSQGPNPRHSQSITLSGNSVSVKTTMANSIKINVTFPKASSGFGEDFFRFSNTEEVIDVTDGSIVEFYSGEVVASLGLTY